MTSLIYSLLFIAGVTLTPLLTQAQSRLDGIAAINADSMYRDSDKRTIVLSGQVQIVFDGQHIKADRATIYLKSKEVHAEGNVVLKSQDSMAEAERIKFNYDSGTGTLYDAYVQAGQVVFEGDVIEKKSKTEYVATGAKYTACTTCPPAWSFSGQKIEAEVGGYAYIKYPVLRVGDIPILILPAILVPLKSSRQSGFLVPTLDFSSAGGAAIAQSYFWAIDRSSDLTLTAKRYEKRGWQSLFDYRYVFTEQSRGQIQAGFIGDKRFSADGNPSSNTEELNRGFANYTHYYKMPSNWIQRANLHYTSDLRYPRDFSDQVAGHKDPALGNRLSLTKNSEHQHFSAETEVYINLLQEDALAPNDSSVHRFPEIRYSTVEREIYNSNLYFSLDFNYVNFARRDYSYDKIITKGTTNASSTCDVFGGIEATPKCVDINTTGDTTGDQNYNGTFNPEDLIRSGQRLDIVPKVNFPFHLGEFDFLPSMAYNETFYRFNTPEDPVNNPDYTQEAARGYLQTDFSVKTRLGKVFESDEGSKYQYKHDIIPEVIFSRRHFVERPDSAHPFFGNIADEPYSRFDDNVTIDDFYDTTGTQKIRFDYRDRVFDQNIVGLALTNHIIRKRIRAGVPEYKKIVTLRLGQSFDFLEERRGSSTRWSTVQGLFAFDFDNVDGHTTAEYYPYARVSDIFSRIRLKADRGDFVELSYTQDVDVADERENLSENRDETVGLGLGFISRFINLSGRLEYDAVTFGVDSWQYTAQFKPPGDCWGVQFSQKKVAGADDVVFKFDFNFDFGGDQKKTFF